MNVKRKTVRFQDLPGDLAAYEAISNYKSYGFRSESHMVITAVTEFISKEKSNLSPEELADLIAARLSGSISLLPQTNVDQARNTTSTDEIYNAALSFIDNL